MSLPASRLPGALLTRLRLLAQGLLALPRLALIVIAAWRNGAGPARDRITAALATSPALRAGFDFARAFWPNPALSRRFITAYANTGTVIVTRYDDVKDVLRRDGEFTVVYGPRMQAVTGGHNFFLGMQDSPDYTRDVSNMRLVVRRDDLPGRVAPFLAHTASVLAAAAGARIDVPAALTRRVPARLVAEYFGTPGPDEDLLIEWATLLFWYLFNDLQADPQLDARALAAAEGLRSWLDQTIVARKQAPRASDDVLARCLALQASGTPGMGDLEIRNNLLGLIVGAIPTQSRAAVQVLNQLLLQPQALAAAQQAARSDDDEGLARHVLEALRFDPINPMIYRYASCDAVIAPNTWRARKVRAGTMVFAANLSAMFDPLRIADPGSFRVDRPSSDYILWGDGLHTCFGAHLNRVALPAMLKPLLRRPGLRRAAGPAGQIDCQGTPFPVHFWVESDAT